VKQLARFKILVPEDYAQRHYYHFLSSAGLRCTPLTITVRDREDIRADLKDIGFVPNVIHLEQGNAIKWQWKTTNVPRMIFEVQYCSKHCSIVKPEKNG
jgi:hypothetical protein